MMTSYHLLKTLAQILAIAGFLANPTFAQIIFSGDLVNPTTIAFSTVNGGVKFGVDCTIDQLTINGTAELNASVTLTATSLTIVGTTTVTSGTRVVIRATNGLALRGALVGPSSGAATLDLYPNQGSYTAPSSVSGNVTVIVHRAPEITSQPSSVSAAIGERASLTVVASSAEPVTYQWQKNGNALNGATISTLSFASLQSSDAGSYSVVVTNSIGRVTSSIATLTVNAAAGAPSITAQPQSQSVSVSAAATFAVVASSTTPLTYQWQKDDANIAGATNSTYTVASALSGDAGNYRVLITNTVGTVTSTAATLTISTATAATLGGGVFSSISVSSPTSLTADTSIFGALNLSSSVSGNFKLSIFGTTTIAGASTISVGDLSVFGQTNYDAGARETIRIGSNGSVSWFGTIVGPATGTAFIDIYPGTGGVRLPSVPANVVVTIFAAPKITTQPSALTITAGRAASFTVVATGVPTPSYQWLRNGSPIADATNANLNYTNARISDAGSYSVVVSNSVGSVTSDAVQLTVNAAPEAPSISIQPSNQSAPAGTSTRFSVLATGTAPLAYQWRKDGVPIVGATGTTLSITNIQPSDGGSYTVTVSNPAGSIQSDPATLSVIVLNPGRLVNLSILAPVVSGETMTLGTVLGGAGTKGTKPLLLRAVGPSLSQFGISTPLPNPQMTLNATSTSPAVIVDTNVGWGGSVTLINAFVAVGAFPYMSASSRDSALFGESLVAGNYTLQVTDPTGGAGVIMAELYEFTPAGTFTSTTPRLINVSVLKPIAPGSSLTAGFVIGGTTNLKVLVRAIGPTLGLAPFGVPDVIADPKLALFASFTRIYENDDWGTSVAPLTTTAAQLSAVFTSVGAFQLGSTASKDAVLLVTLRPGAYTVEVSGSAGSGGTVLVEVYEVP